LEGAFTGVQPMDHDAVVSSTLAYHGCI